MSNTKIGFPMASQLSNHGTLLPSSGTPLLTQMYTPIQQRIMDRLADGKPHPQRDLLLCLQDDWGSLRNLRNHLSQLRKKLRPTGLDILFTIHHRHHCYQLVRRFQSDTTRALF